MLIMVNFPAFIIQTHKRPLMYLQAVLRGSHCPEASEERLTGARSPRSSMLWKVRQGEADVVVASHCQRCRWPSLMPSKGAADDHNAHGDAVDAKRLCPRHVASLALTAAAIRLD